jgi:hypothetical protein
MNSDHWPITAFVVGTAIVMALLTWTEHQESMATHAEKMECIKVGGTWDKRACAQKAKQ